MAYKNLGWANGWTETPEEVKKCEDMGHKKEYKKINWNCCHQYACKICKYFYRVDSGD